jgi:RNA polymerase sigma factor (sigma-70 family)
MTSEPAGPAGSVGWTVSDLQRVCDRDPAAMNRFFDAYYDRAHGYVTRLVRDATLAEDLTQEAFLRMHAALDRLDPTRDPAPWVFTVITNTVRDHWRSRQHKAGERSVALDDVWDLPSAEPAPDHALERGDDQAMVRAAMGRLSPADREILLLRCTQERDHAEVGEILGIKPEAVRQRYSRAVRRLTAAYRGIVAGTETTKEEEAPEGTSSDS